MIAANEPQGAGVSGPLLDGAFLDLPVIRAIRGRWQAIASAIVQIAGDGSRNIRVAGIGCGAADPLFSALSSAVGKSRIEPTAIEFDRQALGAASERCKTLDLTDRFQLVDTNIVQLASGRNELEIQDQDVIYGLNISDHLDGRLLLRFLNRAYEKLRPGGQLLLSSVHAANPERAFLDYVIDWKIVHRNEEEINALLVRSSFQSPAKSFTVDSGKITFVAVCERSR
jgi:SAM-dependent methyltransferase